MHIPSFKGIITSTGKATVVSGMSHSLIRDYKKTKPTPRAPECREDGYENRQSDAYKRFNKIPKRYV